MKTLTAYGIVGAITLGAFGWFYANINPNYVGYSRAAYSEAEEEVQPIKRNSPISKKAYIKQLRSKIAKAKQDGRNDAEVQWLEEQLEDTKFMNKPYTVGRKAKQRIQDYTNEWEAEAEDRQFQELENYIEEHRKRSFSQEAEE